MIGLVPPVYKPWLALLSYRIHDETTSGVIGVLAVVTEKTCDDDFAQAMVDVKKLLTRPDNDTLLQLYALYKQATAGDVSGPQPGFFDFVGTAKQAAWASLRGTDRTDAQRRYVALVQGLCANDAALPGKGGEAPVA